MRQRWIKIKPNQYRLGRLTLIFLIISVVSMLGIYFFYPKHKLLLVGAIALGIIGVTTSTIAHVKLAKVRNVSILIENYIRSNDLLQHHFVDRTMCFRKSQREIIDYYPMIDYKCDDDNNSYTIRFRLDGSYIGQKLRGLNQSLADLFSTICTEIKETRGYIEYTFEEKTQEQIILDTVEDVPLKGTNEIILSRDILWNWKKTVHMLIVGNTGSGKTFLTQYIIYCLLYQGARVIYCDPKKDDDMRFFSINNPSVKYVTGENEIAQIVRETEQEVRMREKDLEAIGIEEAEFNPVFLFFDELIAYSKVASKKNYDEVSRYISAMVVTGRSKCVYIGLILQRPDTSFVEGAIRDNLGCRIAMGDMTNIAYSMVFGSEYGDVNNMRNEIGSGLIYRQGVDTKPREFIAPFIKSSSVLQA